MKKIFFVLLFFFSFLTVTHSSSSGIYLLDGDDWCVFVDDETLSSKELSSFTPDTAIQCRVPSFMTDYIAGDVVWYQKNINIDNFHKNFNYILKFYSVYYRAEVWFNGNFVSMHDGGDTPFFVDVTKFVKKGDNILAIRVSKPCWNRDTAGDMYARTVPGAQMLAKGGIEDSVELIVVEDIWIEDLYVRPHADTGIIDVNLNIRNFTNKNKKIKIDVSVTAEYSGGIVASDSQYATLNSGDTSALMQLKVKKPRLWNLDDPQLYSVKAKITSDKSSNIQFVRCGFRDFRFENGYFRLNGKRIFLRGVLTTPFTTNGIGKDCERELLRKEMIDLKMMGFNMVRYIAYPATRDVLEICNEIGMMIDDEPRAGWLLNDEGLMRERYTSELLAMVKRDRNHPSVTMYGLLNEIGLGHHMMCAIDALPLLRKLDADRVVLLVSGGSDGLGSVESGMDIWMTDRVCGGIIKKNDTLSVYPGSNKEYSTVRWVSPKTNKININVKFEGDSRAISATSTGVFVLHNGEAIYSSFVGVNGKGNTAEYINDITVESGDTLDFVVNYGHWFDSFDSTFNDNTNLFLTITDADGQIYNPCETFSVNHNPSSVWSYGYYDGKKYENDKLFVPSDFILHNMCKHFNNFGSYCNPDTDYWGMGLSDMHHYPGVPHFHWDIDTFRTMSPDNQNVLLSEYGVGSAFNHLEMFLIHQMRGDEASSARYKGGVNRFDSDWERWKLSSIFGTKEDFFRESYKLMSDIRYFGTSGIRANPKMTGHFITCSCDPNCGDGLFTMFRKPKTGLIDKMYDIWRPVALCCFASPTNLYRGSNLTIDVTLANEDIILPGVYPLVVQIFSEENKKVYERYDNILIEDKEMPLTIHAMTDNIVADWPSGKYRMVAYFEHGIAANGEVIFYVGDKNDMPAIFSDIVVWGDDEKLSKWFDENNISYKQYDKASYDGEIIIVGENAPDNPKVAFEELMRLVNDGAHVIFLKHSIFSDGKSSVEYLPFENKGRFIDLQSWLFTKDVWIANNPVFDSLPTGMMDYTLYRGIVPPTAWDVPLDIGCEAIVGAIETSSGGYTSGLMMSLHKYGKGSFIITTLRIHDYLGERPIAERLLRNMINYVSEEVDK